MARVTQERTKRDGRGLPSSGGSRPDWLTNQKTVDTANLAAVMVRNLAYPAKTRTWSEFVVTRRAPELSDPPHTPEDVRATRPSIPVFHVPL